MGSLFFNKGYQLSDLFYGEGFSHGITFGALDRHQFGPVIQGIFYGFIIKAAVFL